MTDQAALSIVSVVIAVLALSGVIVSLLLQVRQLRVSQREASRAAMLEIVKLFIGDPELFADPDDSLYSNRNQAGALFQAGYRRQW
jgi:hypothetical protein